jgi:hypothetical protein
MPEIWETAVEIVEHLPLLHTSTEHVACCLHMAQLSLKSGQERFECRGCSLVSLDLRRGVCHNPLYEMWVFGIQHAQMVLPMLHMDVIPRLT